MNVAVAAASAATVRASVDLKRPRIAGGIWLAAWTLLLLWTAHALATAWPYVGLMPQWALLVAMPGAVFRAFDLLWMRLRTARVAGWRRLLARALAVIVGVPGAVLSWEGLDALSMHRFEAATAPLVARLHANPPTACPPESGYALGADFAAYLDDSSAPRAQAQLHYGADRFVLAFPGRAMDIDGSTMFYDSVDRSWRKRHNDTLDRTGELITRVRGLTACRFRLH